MEKKMETSIGFRALGLGLHSNNGKENANYCSI